MSNMNFDENTINKIKDMMNKGELDDVISNIPPEMFQNFSNIMNNSNKSSETSKNPNLNKNTASNNNNFDFNNIDINTILKLKSAIDSMNSTNDPRSNLLHSLKPYLRDERKQKVDQYANLLNFAKIAELLNNDNKENNKND